MLGHFRERTAGCALTRNPKPPILPAHQQASLRKAPMLDTCNRAAAFSSCSPEKFVARTDVAFFAAFNTSKASL